MTGLLLLFVAAVWFALAAAIAIAFTRRIENAILRSVLGATVFGVLLVLPVLDELIGKWQFDSLCEKYAVVQVDERHAANRRVFSMLRKNDHFAEGTILQIRIDPYIYRDSETNEILVRYHLLYANGGWLIQSLGISETGAPLLFQSGCAPPDRYAFKKKFNITVLN